MDKKIKRLRKREQARDEIRKDVNGQILGDDFVVTRRWTQNFEKALNVVDEEANINIVGHLRMPVLGELNERAMSIEGVREAVNEFKQVKLKVWTDFKSSVKRKVL